MSGGEESVVTATAALTVVFEVACAIVLGDHASLLRGASAACYNLLTTFKFARIDVNVATGVKHCLCLHVDVLNKNVLLFHFFRMIL